MLAPRFVQASTRRASSYVCCLCQTSTRSFQSSTWYRARPVKAPSIARASRERARQETIRNNPQASTLGQDAKAEWPFALLRSAKASGALHIEPEEAVSFLESYRSLGSQKVEAVERLCQLHQIEPFTLTLLSQILHRTTNEHHKVIGNRLLFSASALKDPTATLKVVSNSLVYSYLTEPEMEGPLKHLSTLAKQKNTAAMMFLAQILERQGKTEKALHYFEEVAHQESSTYTEGDDVEGAVAKAWLALGRLRINAPDIAPAEAALKKAALVHDDPVAYFYLARLRHPKSSDYLLYNLKAASSGVTEAAHNLGILYLQQSKPNQQTHSFLQTKFTDGRDATEEPLQSQQSHPASSFDVEGGSPKNLERLSPGEKRALALEWFSVAAWAGFAPSMVNLALLLRADGSYEQGFAWLKQVEEHPDFGAEAQRLREQWWEKDVDLTRDVP